MGLREKMDYFGDYACISMQTRVDWAQRAEIPLCPCRIATYASTRRLPNTATLGSHYARFLHTPPALTSRPHHGAGPRCRRPGRCACPSPSWQFFRRQRVGSYQSHQLHPLECLYPAREQFHSPSQVRSR